MAARAGEAARRRSLITFGGVMSAAAAAGPRLIGRAKIMTRVCFNGRFLGRPVTGVERFAGEIIRAVDRLWAQSDAATDNMDFEVVRPPGHVRNGGFSCIPDRVVGTRSGHLWEQIDLPHYARDSILVNLCNTAPLLQKASVTCVHDANVFLNPRSYAWAFRMAYQIMLPLVIRRSSRWITVSTYSAVQLARLGVSDRPPSAIVGNGTEHIQRLQPVHSRFRETELPGRFVLAIGSRSRNKNVALLVAIAGALHAAGLSIILVGDGNPAVFGRSAMTRHPNIVNLGRVEDDDIAFLYSRALCFVFPSFYEGFGIPAIEAMACGCPVVAARSSALPEVLGNAAVFCPPTDAQAWQSAIVDLARDADLRARLIAAGREQARLYSWRVAALRILQVVRTLA